MSAGPARAFARAAFAALLFALGGRLETALTANAREVDDAVARVERQVDTAVATANRNMIALAGVCVFLVVGLAAGKAYLQAEHVGVNIGVGDAAPATDAAGR